jgi:hypothetical protein
MFKCPSDSKRITCITKLIQTSVFLIPWRQNSEEMTWFQQIKSAAHICFLVSCSSNDKHNMYLLVWCIVRCVGWGSLPTKCLSFELCSNYTPCFLSEPVAHLPLQIWPWLMWMGLQGRKQRQTRRTLSNTFQYTVRTSLHPNHKEKSLAVQAVQNESSSDCVKVEL